MNGQGSIGGRNEETDYIELAPTLHFNSLLGLENKVPPIKLVLRWAFFSGNNSFIASNTGTTLAEAYVQVDSLFNGRAKNLSVWIGQRYYRYFVANMADYFFFNNYTAQGAGLSYHRFKFAILTNVPFNTSGNPYGNAIDPFYQRIMINLQQQIHLNESHSLVPNFSS